jgi:ribosome-associated toxin RatA of RatAB toxin-antitoxin module
MIKVIDNALPESIYQSIKDIIKDKHFPWYLSEDVIDDKIPNSAGDYSYLKDNNTIQTKQFVHTFTSRDILKNSNHALFINKIINGFVDGKIEKSKFNCLFNNNRLDKSKYNIPHVDLNESDGDTIFFNEYYNNTKLDKVTFCDRVSPKENRAVISDGQFHTSTNPINYDMRIVLNAVILK